MRTRTPPPLPQPHPPAAAATFDSLLRLTSQENRRLVWGVHVYSWTCEFANGDEEVTSTESHRVEEMQGHRTQGMFNQGWMILAIKAIFL